MSTISKPTLAKKADAALAFAEGKKEAPEPRNFHAPKGYRRLTINLEESLHKKLKFRALELECTSTEIIERLLKKELG